MEAGKPSLSADQYFCPMCLDALNEPVTISCGHSYCMDCINDYWDKSDTPGIYKCPECRETFTVRPQIKRNTMLKDILEKLKGAEADVGPSQSYAGPDDVSCDVCSRRKRKASKTCLTCMASYCEAHLQPHRKSEAFKRHKLEEATGNLQEKLCAQHHKVLEIFCRTDDTCVCLLCVATEHKSHDTVTPEEERTERQSQLGEKKAEMIKRIQEKEEKLAEMKETIVRIQSSAEKEVQEHEETFKSMLQSIEKLRSEVTEVIRDYMQRKVGKVKELMTKLENEIKDLKTRDTDMTELSQTDDHVHFLKRFQYFCDSLGEEDKFNISINEDFLPDTLRISFSEMKKSLEEMSSWEFVKSSETEVDNPGYILHNLRSRNGLLKC
ncbi:E3 ubiquitin/ISG15 ligase TRIM25-like isoform X2 [Polypterus senegalus]|uniref:E3 ubiquitin/ISG15 ligase TRIM25-like isoform X2 n=1 Tax=Polypterus senegalus TaxID=55291 RepID=UPI0019659335|nr:E3 ubiquitin/ISG15 ligase TRIM25-like isoform X2 [Polypterus senegalus]